MYDENNNFVIDQPEQNETNTQPETNFTPYTYSPVPEPHQKKKKKSGKRAGFAIGVIAASLVVGTAAGFGGSALQNKLQSGNNSQSAEVEDNFPFGSFDSDQEMPERPDGERPGPGDNEGFPFGEGKESKEPAEAPDEDTSSSESAAEPSDGDSSLELTTKSNGTSLSTEEIAAIAADSVVEITTEYVQTGNYMQQYVSSGAGSGVIISEDGYLITNNHVIEDATQITVTLTDGSSYDAVLIGRDDQLDVALLKIDATGLTVASFGDSDTLNLGEKVVAIGNPLGQLGGSVSEGIISSLKREITIDGQAMTLLQTDAAINPGNSGGGLFNDEGQLIGLVVAKSTGEDVEGLGFAIPINNVQAVLNDLLNYGYTTGHAYLGVSLLDITNEQMAMMYRVNETGTYIYSVQEDSAAEKAGLKSGDRIVSIDGTEITSADDVKAILADAEVGDAMDFVIVRNGSQTTVEVTVGEYVPETMPTAAH